jgi:hypothetical protein
VKNIFGKYSINLTLHKKKLLTDKTIDIILDCDNYLCFLNKINDYLQYIHNEEKIEQNFLTYKRNQILLLTKHLNIILDDLKDLLFNKCLINK